MIGDARSAPSRSCAVASLRRVVETASDAGPVGASAGSIMANRKRLAASLQVVGAVRQRPHDAPRLQLGETAGEQMARRRGEEKALAAIRGAGAAARRSPCSMSSFRTRLRLCLVMRQDVEELGDGEAGLPVDEMQDAVMGAPETVIARGCGRDRRRSRDRRRRTARSGRRPAAPSRMSVACRLPDRCRLSELRHHLHRRLCQPC